MSPAETPAPDPLARAKAELRARMRELRRAMPAEDARAAAESAAELLLALPELRAAHVVLAYSATAEEIDPAPAVEVLHAAGIAIALPRIEAPGVMGVHLVAHGDALEAGPLGIVQPTADAFRAPLDSIDAVMVPGVGFDSSGRRLGYGGGFYDRLLPQLRADCLRVGLAFDQQLVGEIPVAEHDEHVQAIVTPTRVVRSNS